MRCLVLFSGSLESLLAARLVQQQGVETIGLFFATLCSRSAPPDYQANALGIKLIVAEQDEAWCEAIRHPTLGRTKNAAACLDCRVQLLRRAKARMSAAQADFLASGEVLGQRPRSQNRRDLEAIAYHAGVEDLLVRPLSAKLLPETLPERQSWIDRQQLQAFHGNAHQGMIALAQQLGLSELPASRSNCGLTDAALSVRVFDHWQHTAANDPGSFALLTVGRHFRLNSTTKVVVGRNRSENEALAEYAQSRGHEAALGCPKNFVGPTAIILGDDSHDSRSFASALMARFGKPTELPTVVRWQDAGMSSEIEVQPNELAATAVALGST